MEDNIDIQKRIDDKEENYNKAVTALSEYRKELAALKESSGNFFEKQLSYISAGALGLSMIVVDKLFKNILDTVWKPLIIVSWICFGLTLFINLISHLYAGSLHNKSISDIDNEKYDQKTVKTRNFHIDLVNYISVAILFIGICCFVIYISKNIHPMSDNKKDPTPQTNRGQSSSTPPPSKPQVMNEGKSASAAPSSLPPKPVPPAPNPSDKR